MGNEIDKVYVEISKYQSEMVNSTTMLESMYEENYQYYLELEKYAVAGQMKADEIKSNQLPLLKHEQKKEIRLPLCSSIP